MVSSCLLAYTLYVAIFQFYVEKYPKDAEDAEVGELCGSAPPHPVRCPELSLVDTSPVTAEWRGHPVQMLVSTDIIIIIIIIIVIVIIV